LLVVVVVVPLVQEPARTAVVQVFLQEVNQLLL
jgi:hypothetical protein